MAQDVTITIALTVFMVLSGCSGLFPANESVDASPTPDAPRTYDQAVENHTETLREIGQFKVRWERRGEVGDQIGHLSPFTNVFVADFRSQQFLWGGANFEGKNGVYQSGVEYQSGNTTWRRIELANGSIDYQRVQSPGQDNPRNETLQQIRTVKNFSTQFPLERNGTTVFQGQQVTRYTADELGPDGRCLTPPRDHAVENVTSVTVVALVDDQGIIRKFECELSGETTTGERYRERLVWTITMIGSVEIRQPEPVSTATNGG